MAHGVCVCVHVCVCLSWVGTEYDKYRSRDSNQILLNNKDQQVLILTCVPGGGEVCYLRLPYLHAEPYPYLTNTNAYGRLPSAGLWDLTTVAGIDKYRQLSSPTQEPDIKAGTLSRRRQVAVCRMQMVPR